MDEIWSKMYATHPSPRRCSVYFFNMSVFNIRSETGPFCCASTNLTFIWCNIVYLKKITLFPLECISGPGLEQTQPCSRPWPSGLSAQHKPEDNQKQSEGTAPRAAAASYTAHEGFSRTGVRARRQQPVIMEIVRCDDSGMLIARPFSPADSSIRTRMKKKCCAEGQSVWN